MLQNVRALTFDCYGTLVDWERGLARDLRAGLDATITASDEELLALYARAESESEKGDFCKYKDILRAALAGVARSLGAPVRDGEALVRGLPSWPVFNDTSAALAALKRQFKLCVVSNVDLDLFTETQKNLGVSFHEIVTADQIFSYKPKLKHFEEAVARLNLPKEEILHVAQSLYHDHAPAKSFGLKTVWIDRRAGRAGGATPPSNSNIRPDYQFTTLEEFARAILPKRVRHC